MYTCKLCSIESQYDHRKDSFLESNYQREALGVLNS